MTVRPRRSSVDFNSARAGSQDLCTCRPSRLFSLPSNSMLLSGSALGASKQHTAKSARYLESLVTEMVRRCTDKKINGLRDEYRNRYRNGSRQTYTKPNLLIRDFKIPLTFFYAIRQCYAASSALRLSILNAFNNPIGVTRRSWNNTL